MLQKNVTGYNQFLEKLEDFFDLSEEIHRVDVGAEPDVIIKSPTTYSANPFRPQYRRYYSLLRDIFEYPFSRTNYSEYKKYIYACFVYSYTRYSEKEIYYNTLSYVEISILTDQFNINFLRSHVDMMLFTQTDAHLFPTINQLDFELKVKLINLLHEIASLFTAPIMGFSEDDINQIIHHPYHPDDFQSYFHNITSHYFNYQQMNHIKTFRGHENYIRALYLSDLGDIACIDSSVLKVLGIAFYDNVNHFNIKSKSKETILINFSLVSEFLYDMKKETHYEIWKISNMISIAASIDLTQVMNLF